MPEILLGDEKFYYESRGKGESVIFISGMGGDHADWRYQLPSHARYFRCLTFDNRGIGKSAKAASGLDSASYTMELLASDLARLMDALGIERAHIVGASMGGAVAQRFAIDHPDRLVSLSLHSTLGRTSSLSKLKFDTQLYLLKKLDVVDVLMSLAPMIWSERTLSERRYIIEAFRATRGKKGLPVDKGVYSLQAKALMSVDWLSRLGEIKAPVLITAGADDGLIPAFESRLIHKAIPGSEYHVFSGCGHASSIENSRGFNSVSIKFLKRHGGKAT